MGMDGVWSSLQLKSRPSLILIPTIYSSPQRLKVHNFLDLESIKSLNCKIVLFEGTNSCMVVCYARRIYIYSNKRIIKKYTKIPKGQNECEFTQMSPCVLHRIWIMDRSPVMEVYEVYEQRGGGTADVEKAH